MLHIYLPGYSHHNHTELDDFVSLFTKNGLSLYAHRWAHWDDQTVSFDVGRELERVTESSRLAEQEEVGLIGKSIGTYVAAELVKRFSLSPKYLVMLGIPLNDLSPDENRTIAEVMTNQGCPKYVIQNVSDAHGTAQQVKELLRDSNFELIEKEGDTHAYNFPEEVFEIISKVTHS